VIDRAELFRRRVTTTEQAKQWIADLIELDLLFHFEDSPREIINIKTGERTFTDAEAQQISARLDEIYGFNFGNAECPIGYALDLTEPGWRNR